MGVALIPRTPPQHVADEARWASECAGKEPYPSEMSAEAALAYLKRTGTLRGSCWLETYPCTSCKQWHLGNSRRRER